NLMLTPEGVVKVLDFGLARLAEEQEPDAALTRSGAVMGTADFLAPEQAQDAHTADIRADIYSLGATLYYLLIGEAPFAGGSLAQKLLRLQQATPEPVERRRPDLPPSLGAVVGKMMAKRPQDRYQTPAEAAAALAPFDAPATPRQPPRR